VSRLTPIDIQHAEFSRRSLGYDRREVRAFLERLALEVEAALKDTQGLRRRLADAEAEIERLRGSASELQQVVVAAERIAGDVRENAKREARQLVEEAERARRARLDGIEAAVGLAASELDRLRQQKRLFREQFRGLLEAYSAALQADDASGEAPKGAEQPPAGARAPSLAARVAAEPEAATIEDAAAGALLDDSVEP